MNLTNTTLTSSGLDVLDEHESFYRLLENCLSYATIVGPLTILSTLSKSQRWSIGRLIRRYSHTAILKWCFFGHRISTTSTGAAKWSATNLLKDYKFAKLLFCVVGLQFSYVTWGVFQEKIMTQPYESVIRPGVFDSFGDSEFVVFVNRLVSFTLAAAAVCALRVDTTYAPLHDFSYASVANVLSSWCQYEALKYITFPAQMLGKSSKILAVMLMGKLVQRRSYPTHQYVSAIVLTAGIMLFFLSAERSSARQGQQTTGTLNSSIAGLMLMAGYLILDSFTSNWQNLLFVTHSISSLQMMAGVNMFSCLLTLFALVTAHHLQPSISFIIEHKRFTFDLLMVSTCSALGQFFIFYTISQFGAVTFTVIMTVRQVFSIILSCILYNHSIGAAGVVGIALVFLALLLKTLWIHCHPPNQVANQLPV